MFFDLRTSLIVQAILHACLGLVCLFLPYRESAPIAIKRWAYAMLMLAAAGIALALRGQAPDFVSIDIANAMSLLSFIVVWHSVSEGSSKRPYVLGWGVFVVAMALLWYFTYLRPDTGNSIVVISVAMALLVVRPALALLRPIQDGRLRARLFTAICLAGIGASMLARALLTLRWGVHSDLMRPDMLQFVSTLAFSLCAVLATLGMVWIDIEQLQADLVHLAMIDSLTDTLNRRAFMLEYERELSRCLREKSALALAIFDLDHFKEVNDNHGHLVGDQVLRSIADRLRISLRGHDVLGRYGGEEFALLMPGADVRAALAAVERVRLAIAEQPIVVGSISVPMTVSAGVAVFGPDGRDWETLLRSADTALYQAKRAGRNRVAAAHPLSKHP